MASSINFPPSTITRRICDGSALIHIWSGVDCTACTHPIAAEAGATA